MTVELGLGGLGGFSGTKRTMTNGTHEKHAQINRASGTRSGEEMM
jgi:hypothetical protein